MNIKPTTPRVLFQLLMLLMAVSLLSSCGQKDESPASSAPKTTVRIGWQIAWATQGQLAMALQKTDALQLCGLKGDFKSFTYGAPLSEAALAGQLDVAFVGDQPAVSLLSRTSEWKIVARLMDFRVAIVVPPSSPIKSVADLKGKTLGIPFGASTHRVALQMLQEAGLDPTKDLKIFNIDILEQSDIVKAGVGGAWPKVDAFASWDHHIALYEKNGYARVLKPGAALGVVMMSQRFLQNHPQEAAAFVAAFKLGYFYYATHQDQVDRWFANAAGGKIDPNILRTVAAIEPNMRATTLADTDIAISPQHIGVLQGAADFAFSQALIKTKLSASASIRKEFAIEAESYLRTVGMSPKAVE
ncbi:MAG: NrtA/SsuA/CpmA family ABC transporter substrate-binding protein [Verrucomicrobia bacterium]|nr:NrtA/SsuA/CpmA family ABC transporter substrate-binding protein [Verrucomicrobiota bacterium]